MVSLVGLTLHVADVDRSVEFYRRLPGAAVLFHLPGRFAMLRLGAGRLGLLPDRKAPFHGELEVADLETAAAELRSLGFELDGPARRAWGEEDVLLTDPDGNLLELAAPRGQEGRRSDRADPVTEPVSRRDLIAALLSTAALPLMAACGHSPASSPAPASPAAPGDASALALLDQVGENLLRLFPEAATSLGIDTGPRAGLRSRLFDRSAEGKERLARQVRADLDRVNAVETANLSHPVRTSVEVVRSAYTTALEGLALPYGDITVGGWRNTPYVVIQNVGAYLDVPRFLDIDHRIESAADAEAYLARLESLATQLDGGLGRARAARETGLVPPAFLLDKALGQLRLSAKGAREGGTLVGSIERRTKTIPGDWAERARCIAAG